jgi:hypothetical protein
MALDENGDLTVDHKFKALFYGNHEVIGGDNGLAIKLALTTSWDERLTDHLDGHAAYGAYPIYQNEWCSWGCVDVDLGYEASLPHALNLQRVLQLLGITGWVEKTRSKGYHIWVFADGPVKAKLMRQALTGACQLAECPTKEVNPKQESVEDGHYGNYVRLPYPGREAGADGRRAMRTEDGGSYSFDAFVLEAWDTRIGSKPLQRAADLYRAPERPKPSADRLYVLKAANGAADSRMSPLARKRWQDGPSEGMDRSGALLDLA